MTIHLIHHIPVCHAQICQRVIAREMIFMLEGLPIGSETWLHKQVVQSPDKQGIERHDDQQRYQCL